MTQPPLNPDAVGRMFATAMMEVLDAEKLQPGDRLAHVNDMQEVLNRLEKKILAAALPEVTSVEELEALPIGAVIVINGTMLQAEDRDDYGTMWSRVRDIDAYPSDALALPARVLYRPEVNDA